MIQRVDAVNRPPNRIRYGWPLYSLDWEALPPEVQGDAQWQSSPLGYASRRSIPPTTGVYMMCVRPPAFRTMAAPFDDLFQVIYVGRARNLRNRYAQHLNTPSPKVRAARVAYSDSLRFWFLHIPAERISYVESALISCLGPSANDQPGDIFRLESGPTSSAASSTLTVKDE